MESLYKISQSLESIFHEIEENEGEITDELNEKLKIKEDELVEKLENYHKAIRTWQNSADFCKTEKQRLNSLQNIYKNRVERLKNAMLNAVISYGYTGKSGNKVFELPDSKLFTKTTESLEINELRLSKLLNKFLEYAKYLQKFAGFDENSCLTKDELVEGFNEFINSTNIEQGENEENPFTIDDLNRIKVKFEFNIDCLMDLFCNHESGSRKLLDVYLNAISSGNCCLIAHITPNMENNDWKLAITEASAHKEDDDITKGITVAKKNKNTNLCIN